jgi:hypothetical protein
MLVHSVVKSYRYKCQLKIVVLLSSLLKDLEKMNKCIYLLLIVTPICSEFNPEDAPLMFGRTSRCAVQFKDTSLSRH